MVFFNLLHYFCIFADMEEKKKQERSVIHLEFQGEHYYYGNLKAMFDAWGEALGVSYNYLRNYGVAPGRPYKGKQCIIRKGTIITSPHSVSADTESDNRQAV